MRFATAPAMWSPFRIGRIVLVALGGALTTPAGAVRAEVRLVASTDLVAVLDGTEVAVFTAQGQLHTRLPPRVRAQTFSPAPSGGPASDRGEQIFELHDVPTELRDSQEAEDLLDDELPLRERRAAPIAEPLEPERAALAAADGAGLWVAAGGHLYRLVAHAAALRVGRLPGIIERMAAADAGRLVLATRRELVGSDDGGRTFRPLIRLDRKPTHLTVHPALAWLGWADAAGVHLSSGSEVRSFPLAPVRDLQSCDGLLVVLSDTGIHVGAPGGAPVQVSGALPAPGLVCPRSGPGPWLAFGEALLQSVDQGRSFRSRRDAPPGLVTAAALTRDRIWLAAGAGLRSLPLEESATRAGADSPLEDADVLSPGPARPAWFLPRLTLAASYATSAGQRDFRALAVAELPLGGSQHPQLPAPAARRIARADPSAQEPAASYPAPDPPSAAAYPYPPPDPDAGCLASARTAAVALAQAEPERARSLVVRAGRAAWLPELRLRGEKRMGRSESLDVRAGGATTGRDAFGLDASNDLRYEVRATWDLPRLVFSPEEVAAVHQALRMSDMRREIESQVNRVYFERRRLLVPPPGSPPVEATGALLRVEELDAELDALSAGEFSRCRGVGRHRRGP
jgi:hypothetical protein